MAQAQHVHRLTDSVAARGTGAVNAGVWSANLKQAADTHRSAELAHARHYMPNGNFHPKQKNLEATDRENALSHYGKGKEYGKRASEIAPDLASVWLERGALEAASDAKDAARAAWLKAIELDRDGIIAEAAQLRLQRMEAGN